jgi:hypothetical protein
MVALGMGLAQDFVGVQRSPLERTGVFAYSRPGIAKRLRLNPISPRVFPRHLEVLGRA